MCSKATCRKCGKTTWSGCGKHVKQVMRGVPADKQCTCGSKTGSKTGAADKPRTAADSAAGTTSGRLRSLFRR